MGTNYYMRVTGGHELPDGMHIDDECNMAHVGKRSHGWRFMFQGHESVRSWRDWCTVLENVPCVIHDEYGCEMDVMTFVTTVVLPSMEHGAYNETADARFLGTAWDPGHVDDDGFLISDGRWW